MSLSRMMRYSFPSTEISVPAYFPYKTVSPTFTVIGPREAVRRRKKKLEEKFPELKRIFKAFRSSKLKGGAAPPPPTSRRDIDDVA